MNEANERTSKRPLSPLDTDTSFCTNSLPHTRRECPAMAQRQQQDEFAGQSSVEFPPIPSSPAPKKNRPPPLNTAQTTAMFVLLPTLLAPLSPRAKMSLSRASNADSPLRSSFGFDGQTESPGASPSSQQKLRVQHPIVGASPASADSGNVDEVEIGVQLADEQKHDEFAAKSFQELLGV